MYLEKNEKKTDFTYLFLFGGAIMHPQQITAIPGIRNHRLTLVIVSTQNLFGFSYIRTSTIALEISVKLIMVKLN